MHRDIAHAAPSAAAEGAGPARWLRDILLPSHAHRSMVFLTIGTLQVGQMEADHVGRKRKCEADGLSGELAPPLHRNQNDRRLRSSTQLERPALTYL